MLCASTMQLTTLFTLQFAIGSLTWLRAALVLDKQRTGLPGPLQYEILDLETNVKA